MEIRSADIDDLDALVDVASIIDPPADDAEPDVNYYRHLLERGHVAVAEASHIVIGYAATIDVGGTRHLSDLFLHQDARGQDIGRRLLAAVWDRDVVSAPRQTFSSLHRAALPLYIRAGMTPLWPLLYLNGPAASLPRSDLEVRQINGLRAAELEAQWLGWHRSAEYRYWAGRPGARIFVVSDGETPVAVGCSVRNRTMYTVSRLACAEGSMMPEAAAAAARWCGDDILVAVPGPSPAVPMLVDAGWQLVEHDLYCASEPGLIDAERLLPHPGLL